MSDSESIILIVTVSSNSDRESMGNNMMAIDDLIAYSSPKAALNVSHQHMNAQKEGRKLGQKKGKEEGKVKQPLSPTLLQSLRKERARRGSEPYELGQRESEGYSTHKIRIHETEKNRPVMTKGYLRRRQTRDQAFEEEIQCLRYENDVLKAQVCVTA